MYITILNIYIYYIIYIIIYKIKYCIVQVHRFLHSFPSSTPRRSRAGCLQGPRKATASPR